MARTHSTRIDTKAGRAALPSRREPYWHKITSGRYLGARRLDDGSSTWVARFQIDRKKYYESLGDDSALDFDAAVKKANAWFDAQGKATNEGAEPKYTVQNAIDDYVAHVRANKGSRAADLVPGRLTNHLPDRFKAKAVTAVTTRDINAWMHGQVRTEAELAEADITDPAIVAEKIRASKDTANRRLAVLKACLNLAFRNGIVASDTAWRRVKRFENTSAARKLFLTEKQVAALLAKAAGGVHNAIKAGVLTGARRGELFAVRVRDFDASEGTLQVSGKTGSRTIYLSDSGVVFFKTLAKGKLPEVHLLTKDDGTPWPEDDLNRPFKAAARAARLPPETTFYSLRHYHISKALLAGVQPQVVAENCGTSLRMIEKHYGKFLKADRRAMFNAVAL